MIDLNFLRDNEDSARQLLLKKNPEFPVDQLIDLDKKVRLLSRDVENLRNEKNELAKRGKSGVTPELIETSRNVGNALKASEKKLEEVQEEFSQLYLRTPNIPSQEVPHGNKESNKEVRKFGAVPTFDFPIKDHVELATALGWVDFQQAAAMSGNNFVLYRNEGVECMYALIMYMLKHNSRRGFSYVLPPALVNGQTLYNSGNFPKFKDDVYATQDDLYLIPTSEVCLANMYRDTIFTAEELPLRLTSATSCFRREAGGYGAQERGLIRIHQFEKVEIFSYCEQEQSMDELEYMVATAELILQQLGLHYRVVLLAGQDASFQSAKTYDLEVWMPSQKRFVEISSCSNCTDFQARRAGIRYRKKSNQKTSYVHTLNASSLALPRLVAALIETYQQPDGSVKLPEFLYNFGLYGK